MPSLESQLARSVLARNLKVRKGESVIIESWTHGLPYVRPFVEEVRRLGGEPLVLYEDERAWWSGVSGGLASRVGTMSRAEKAALKAADVYVYFWGPEDRPRFAALPERAGNAAFASNDQWYTLAGKQGLRGCRMSVAFATDPAAKAFGLNGERWRRQLASAGLADAARMYRDGQRISKRLRMGREVRIRHKNGTDLTLGLARREARVETGIVDKAAHARPFGFLANSPAGTVLVAVDESTASGSIVSNLPYYSPGLRVGTGRWEFSDGKLLSMAYDAPAAEVEKLYGAAAPGRERPSILSLGLNPKARAIPQYEEIESGVAVVGIGGNSGFGGKTANPFGLYSVLRGSDVEVDGTPVVRSGRLA
jgi:leucyl aminopeptidase (aminopeptidase T)